MPAAKGLPAFIAGVHPATTRALAGCAGEGGQERYRDGEAHHFVELEEDGTLIRAE
jgi:hypothetical protein